VPTLTFDTRKIIVWNAENFRVNLDIVGLAVFEQIVMRMERGSIFIDGNRVEMEPVSKAADYCQLIFT